MTSNPFPGAQPYRASDRERFFGRMELARRLRASILASRCVTVYGPSGAGKSSLLQAAVIPMLVELENVRVVRVDAWPEGEEPMRWLAGAMYGELGLGEVPADMAPREAVFQAARSAARQSSRLLVLYLDQLEQLLFANRTIADTAPFFDCLEELVSMPLRTLRVVLSLREDYLGRFRDRLRDLRRVTEGGFRVGPLSVADLVEAVVLAAAAGQPPQVWSVDEMRALMLQVRVLGQPATDEAEAQSAYAQIICRALFEERAQGKTVDVTEAEPILHGYLESTVAQLDQLRLPGQRLLEEYLVSEDGSRTLRTEQELCRIVAQPELGTILQQLERAAILIAREHQGGRYFEIGHDWLARRVFERRRERERVEALAKERAAARKQRQVLALIAGVSILFAAVTLTLLVMARREQRKAEAARIEAIRKQVDANDQRILVGYLALTTQGSPSYAMKLLPEVVFPGDRVGWLAVANEALGNNALRVTLGGDAGPLSTALFSPNGEQVLTAGTDGMARIWNASGEGTPVVLSGHRGPILSAAWSPDGKRVLTTSADGTARVWKADGTEAPLILVTKSEPVLAGAFSHDGARLLLGGHDGVVRIFAADGSSVATLYEYAGPIRNIAFLKDDQRVLTATDNRSVRVWTLEENERPTRIRKDKQDATAFALSADGKKMVTLFDGGDAGVVDVGSHIDVSLFEFRCWERKPRKAAISPDGLRAAIGCSNGKTLIFDTDFTYRTPIIVGKSGRSITDIAFRPDGQFVAVASLDQGMGIVEVYSVHGGAARMVLRGHKAAIGTISFSADGKNLVTTARPDGQSIDYTAKIWSTKALETTPFARYEGKASHSAALDPRGSFVAMVFDNDTVGIRRIDEDEVSRVLEGHKGWITHAAWSPRGDRVVTASFDGTARVWATEGENSSVILGGQPNTGHKAAVRFAAFTPDGSRVVTASEDHTAKIWDASNGNVPIATLTGHEDWVTWAAFSPDGSRVATASHDQRVRVFDASGTSLPMTLSGHVGPVNSVAFDADGRRIATASDDGTVRVFSVDGTSQPIVLGGHGNAAMLFAVWNAAGTQVAAAASDGFAYVWPADGNGEPIVLTSPKLVSSLSFLDRDRTLRVVLADGTIHEVKIHVDTLLDALRSAHADCLPPHIRTKYLNETEECATNAFELCESAHGRRAAPTSLACQENSALSELTRLLEKDAAKNPDAREELAMLRSRRLRTPPRPVTTGIHHSLLSDLGSDGRRASLIVLPADTEVYQQGKRLTHRNGLVDLIGKKGDRVALRVSRAGYYLELDAEITNEGVIPTKVDLASKFRAFMLDAPIPGGDDTEPMPELGPAMPNPLIPPTME